ncbi:MAG TPA: hypothetical protein ENK18_13735 [Deltaproteobacteria bacterium]|nr:hypothetical protein [Deltaproteobacteria bacterium]
MTALLESLTWWPWHTGAKNIHSVRHTLDAPGLITLQWATLEEGPTTLLRADGAHLFQDPTRRTEHQVTLTGTAGTRESIVIHAGDHERVVELGF